MHRIDGKSKVYGIFGDPVSHSLSPDMQNAALVDAEIDAVYIPFHVTPENLSAAVDGMRALQIGGVNVTLPHKQAIVPLLDRIDEDAALIGAVNTIVNRGSELVGYNTDGLGFVRSLREDLYFVPEGKEVLMLGAGGACRAAVVALLKVGVETVGIVNRSKERAEHLASALSSSFPRQKIEVYDLSGIDYLEALGRADLIVNTTSLGLKGESIPFCPLGKVKASASIYDMVYSTADTPFVAAAKRRGLSAVDGIGMLAAQGEEAFFLWFNIRPKGGLMVNCLQKNCTIMKS